MRPTAGVDRTAASIFFRMIESCDKRGTLGYRTTVDNCWGAMHIFHRRRAFGFHSLRLMVIGSALLLAAQTATAADKIEYCATGSIALGPFLQHIAELRKTNRYSKEEIDKLIADERSGGP
jgi:hypothetical protein